MSFRGLSEIENLSQRKKQIEVQLERVSKCVNDICVINSSLTSYVQQIAGKQAILTDNQTKLSSHLKRLLPLIVPSSQSSIQTLLDSSSITSEQWEMCIRILNETQEKKEQELVVLKEKARSAHLELTVAQQQLRQKEVEEGAAQQAIESELVSAQDALNATMELLRVDVRKCI